MSVFPQQLLPKESDRARELKYPPLSVSQEGLPLGGPSWP